MVAKIMFPQIVTRDHLKTATSQGGLRPAAPVDHEFNIGDPGIQLLGTGEAPADIKMQIIGEGAPGTYTLKATLDDGANWKGRNPDTSWEDRGAALDGGASMNPLQSKAIAIDANGDGVPDRVVVAVYSNLGKIDIYYTTNFDADYSSTGNLTLWAANVNGGDCAGKPSLLYRPPIADARKGSWRPGQRGTLVLAYVDGSNNLQVMRAVVNTTLEWSTVSTITTLTAPSDNDLFLLRNNKVGLVLADVDGTGHSQIILRESADLLNWSDPLSVTDGAVELYFATAIQDKTGKTWFFAIEGSGGGPKAWSTTEEDPINATSFSTETLFTPPYGYGNQGPLSVCNAPNGHILMAFTDHDNGHHANVYYSRYNGSSWSAPAKVYDAGVAVDYPTINIVGGSVWVFVTEANGGNTDLTLLMTRNWVAFQAGYESWSGYDEVQYLAPSLFFRTTGAFAYLGDQVSIGTDYEYHAARMVQLQSKRPTRSLEDDALWEAIFDFGAQNVIPVNFVALAANVQHAHIQFHTADSWTSPSVSQEMSFIKHTFATGSYTLTDGRISIPSATFRADELRGERIKFSGTGNVFVVTSNEEGGEIYVAGIDLEATESGDLYVLSKKLWKSITLCRYRYMRLLIEQQLTAEGYYEVPALAVGVSMALLPHQIIEEDWPQEVASWRLRNGSTRLRKIADPRRDIVLSLGAMQNDQHRKLLAGFNKCSRGARPFVVVPDSANEFDFSVVTFPSGQYSPRFEGTDLHLIEVV